MANTDAMYFKVPQDGDESRGNGSRIFKMGIALLGGACLGFFGVMALSTYSSSTAESSTNLFGLTSSGLRKPNPVVPQSVANQLPGSGPWKDLALAAIQGANGCHRDISANAAAVKGVLSRMDTNNRAMVAKTSERVMADAKSILKTGAFAPLGFFDPMGFSTDVSEGRLLFYREAELKHGRLCMLASLGFLVGEKFSPVLGTPWSKVPSLFAGSPGMDQAFFWVAVSLAMGVAETASYEYYADGETIGEMKTDRMPGDYGWDPLGMKPKNDAELITLQNKELANGRLAMIAIIGMMAQEWATGAPLAGGASVWPSPWMPR